MSLLELDSRVNDGIRVKLLWADEADVLIVSVEDSRTGQKFDIEHVDPAKANDVFHHPFAYASGIRSINVETKD